MRNCYENTVPGSKLRNVVADYLVCVLEENRHDTSKTDMLNTLSEYYGFVKDIYEAQQVRVRLVAALPPQDPNTINVILSRSVPFMVFTKPETLLSSVTNSFAVMVQDQGRGEVLAYRSPSISEAIQVCQPL